MPPDLNLRYVEHHFWKLDELAEAVGTTTDIVQALITARCAPGPIYVLGKDGWWSALSDEPAPQGEAWYAPGSAWGLRRAILEMRNGVTAAAAASSLERLFENDFAAALKRTEHAALAFPNCFDRQGRVTDEVGRAAQREWAAWLTGGYGVCLRIFNARTCVAKEALGAALKIALAREGYDAMALLPIAEALAELILPFAPWQRSTGTPGLTIDRLVSDHKLGSERPYAFR